MMFVSFSQLDTFIYGEFPATFHRSAPDVFLQGTTSPAAKGLVATSAFPSRFRSLRWLRWLSDEQLAVARKFSQSWKETPQTRPRTAEVHQTSWGSGEQFSEGINLYKSRIS